MKRLSLRFENNYGTIITFAIFAVFMGWGASKCFVDGRIAAGVFLTIFDAIMIAFLLYCILHFSGVIIDFKNNCLKMKTDAKKRKCDLDKVEKLEIVFRHKEKKQRYSAKVTAYLKGGKTLAVKFYPERFWSRFGYFIMGGVTNRRKMRIEKQVSGYDFITCRTEK